MASVRSLLAKWLGGAGAPPQAGIRSFLARWLGGSGAETVPTDVECGGSADVARTRSYESSGGAVFDGSATVAQISGNQNVAGGGGGPARKFKPEKATPRKRRVAQTYSHASSGGLELSFKGATSKTRAILASGGLSIRVEYAVSRVRAIAPQQNFVLGSSADVTTYDAIYETEDEELMLFAAA